MRFPTKLTDLQVQFIRDVYRVARKEGEATGHVRMRWGAVGRLAEAFGVSKRAIQYIMRNERRRDIRSWTKHD